MTDLQPSKPVDDLLCDLDTHVALLARCLALAEDALLEGDLESAKARIGLAARAAQQAETAAKLRDSVALGVAPRLGAHVPIPPASSPESCFQLNLPSISRGRSLSSQRVLVVDDSRGLREMFTLILRREGHVVDAVAQGSEALACLERTRYDVIISDASLGSGLSGLDLAYAVRQMSPKVRFILATCAVDELSPVECERLGVDGLLSKPCTPTELRRSVVGNY